MRKRQGRVGRVLPRKLIRLTTSKENQHSLRLFVHYLNSIKGFKCHSREDPDIRHNNYSDHIS